MQFLTVAWLWFSTKGYKILYRLVRPYFKRLIDMPDNDLDEKILAVLDKACGFSNNLKYESNEGGY